MNINPKALLTEALSTNNNEDALQQVASHREAILNYLESAEADETLDLPNPESAWVARVFEALAGPVTVSDEEQAIIDALFSATKGREQELGMIFRTMLLNTLPPALLLFDYWFHGISVIDDKLRRYLLKSPVVQAALSDDARQHSDDPTYRTAADHFVLALASHGLTPLTLFYAIESISGLIEEAIFYSELPEDADFRLQYETDHFTVEPSPLNAEALLEEIEERCDCDGAMARLLLIWTIQIVRYKPFLFRWFKATPLRHGVSLSFTGESERDLNKRWGSDSPLITVGEQLEHVAFDPGTFGKRRAVLRESVRVLRKEHAALNAFDLVCLADQNDYPDWAITTLPTLYIPVGSLHESRQRAWVWREVLQWLPDDVAIDKPEPKQHTLCNGQLIEVLIPKTSIDSFRQIVDRIEKARGINPFPTEIALRGVINQELIDLQLRAHYAGDVAFERSIQIKRKASLKQLLQGVIEDVKRWVPEVEYVTESTFLTLPQEVYAAMYAEPEWWTSLLGTAIYYSASLSEPGAEIHLREAQQDNILRYFVGSTALKVETTALMERFTIPWKLLGDESVITPDQLSSNRVSIHPASDRSLEGVELTVHTTI